MTQKTPTISAEDRRAKRLAYLRKYHAEHEDKTRNERQRRFIEKHKDMKASLKKISDREQQVLNRLPQKGSWFRLGTCNISSRDGAYILRRLYQHGLLECRFCSRGWFKWNEYTRVYWAKWREDKCSSCKGTGGKWEAKTDIDGGTTNHYLDCPDCGGSGFVKVWDNFSETPVG